MITLDGTASATVNSDARGAQWLVELDFTTGTVYYTTAAMNIVANGHTYIGFQPNVVDVSVVMESEDAAPRQVTLGFSIGRDQAILAACLAGGPETYRGKAARLYQQFTDRACQPSGASPMRISGYMEPISVKYQMDKSTGKIGARVEMPISSAGLARSRNSIGLRLTHAQHQQLYPGDRGLEYMQGLIEQPALWLSKRFQAQ